MAPTPTKNRDQDLLLKIRNVCDVGNEFLYKIAHEPTLGSYRIQEHSHKTVPALLGQRSQLLKNTHNLDGCLYDLEYSHRVMKDIEEASARTLSISKTLGQLCSKLKTPKSP